VVLGPELPGQEVVRSVREHQRAVPVKLVHDLHIVIAGTGVLHAVHDALELKLGGLDEEDLRAQDAIVGVEPVGAGHGDGAGREQKELVHGLRKVN